MSSIEERLAQDIAAFTGGIVVTDSDLSNARSEVEDRLDTEQDRRRTVPVVLAAAIVVGVVGVAVFQALGDRDPAAPPANPAPTTPVDPDAEYLRGEPPTSQLIDGLWRVDNGFTLLLFDEDGTVRFDDHGTVFANPVTTGTYEIDGDLITVTPTDDSEPGCIGEVFAMRASLQEPGLMHYVYDDAAVGNCAPLWSPRGTLEQVLPTNKDWAELSWSAESGFQPVSDEADLFGVWLVEGGGIVVEIDPGGSYYVADDSGEPIDTGQWSLQDHDLTLTSSADSGECSEGDDLVLGAVEFVDPGASGGLRWTVKQNTCGGAWADKGWALIPHGPS